MVYCRNCGAQINENAAVCLNCGCAVTQEKAVDNTVSAGFVILAILIPLFGFIYWPVNAKVRPRCAKACGIASIVSFTVSLIASVIAGLVIADNVVGIF